MSEPAPPPEPASGADASNDVPSTGLVVSTEVDLTDLKPSHSSRFGKLVGSSVAMRWLFSGLERVAPTGASVLLEGEPGTGKHALARAIHDHSPRSEQPFVVVDCAPVDAAVLKSSLFGHEPGAFEGAVSDRSGAFEVAASGTLLLASVDELPPDTQLELHDALRSGEYRRLGGSHPFHGRPRVVAATRRCLKDEVRRGKFHEDLYRRLASVSLLVPPLRDRREDIPALVELFLGMAQQRQPAAAAIRIDPETLSALARHDWPGNVRELFGALQRAIEAASHRGRAEIGASDLAVISATETAADLPHSFDPHSSYRETRARFERDFEQRYVRWLLGRHHGNISAAAREARMDRKHLYDLARKHGLRGDWRTGS